MHHYIQVFHSTAHVAFDEMTCKKRVLNKQNYENHCAHKEYQMNDGTKQTKITF